MESPKMREGIKARWVEALRSGKYTQARGALRRKDGDVIQHCCLGVLCELAIEDGVPLVTNEMEEFGQYRYYYDGRYSFLPVQVSEWAGLDSSAPHAEGKHLHNYNDSGSYSFEDIADIIERSL